MKHFTFTEADASPATLLSRQVAQQVGALMSEAILRLGASALPNEEIGRRGVIQVHRDETMRSGPTSTFVWDGKPIVQWRLENWNMRWEWLPDAPPLLEDDDDDT